MEINVKSLSYEDRVQLLKQLIDSFTDVKVTSEDIDAVGENSVEIITNIFTG